MLSTSNLSAAQAENYFVKDDYYTEEEQHEASFWLGKGADNLRLTGTVEKAVFGELLGGVGPNGEVLSGKEIDPEKRRAATDFTFSAPKSVSVAALVQQDERVLAAHHQAVAKAMSVMEERYAQTRISTEMGRQRVTTGNVIVAVFPHATNREAEPQLHSHCVVMNATQLPDGRWFSFANEGAIANKKLLGQIYQNELAIALQNHGYVIEPKAHGQFELVGYSPELLKLFSTRRQQIESLVALWEAEGKTLFSQDGRVLRSRLALYEAAALKSRKRKPTPMQPEQLRQGWNALAQLEDLVLPALPESRSTEGGEQSIESKAVAGFKIAPASSEAIANSELEPAIQHCSERELVFRRTALERFMFEHQLGQTSFDRLQQDIESSTELIQIDENRMTTQAAIRLELETIRLMREQKGKAEPIASLFQVEQQLSDALTIEQRQAIEQVMTAPDKAMAWQGSAGVGKTYALNEVRAIAQVQGFQVRGFAPSAEAAHTLGEALKINTNTVAGLLVSSQQEPEPSLWIIDEAGLLSMKDAHALLQRARKENARVLLVGDTKQLSAVDAGNPFKSLQAGGITLARLDNSLRQQTEELRVAVRLIAEGNVARGINVLEQAGCLQIEADADNQINQMVSDYLALSPVERAETLLLAGTNQERLALVGQLRRSLQAEGTLGQNALAVSSLRRKDLTQVQAQYLVTYEPGDVLMPTQDYKKQGLAKYQHYTVRNIDQAAHRLVVETADGHLLSIDPVQCQRKAVYAAQTIDVAVGDRLRWTKNDRATKTHNGQQFTVAEVLDGGIVRTVDEAGQSQWFSLSGHQHVDYAWVSTTYSAQGKTADRVLALMSEKTTNRESFYVAVSRAKHGLKLYAADRDELLKRAQISKTKENASDYIPLFKIGKGENYAKTQTEGQSSNGRASATDGGDVGQFVRAGIGERDVQEPSADTLRYRRAQSAGRVDGAGNAKFDRGLEPVADILKGHLGSLSRAVAAHVERAELTQCEGFFAGAVAAVNQGVEQLEWAAKNRTQLAAAVDRLDKTVRREAGSARSQTTIGGQLKPATHDYGELWKNYRRGVVASSAGELDYRVGCRAFENGVKQRTIALMLVSSSSMVEQIHRNYGKQQAMQYVKQMTRRICQQQTMEAVHQSSSSRQVELD
ncbi:MobF family relaxase [Leptolyngbya sp. BC1307]|uniref:MobF family relaxase n=1 Tax=Leptolyngbya sp. BC1307 TaxID=2029589 RepID=UPI000EFC090F|nr:MobF family relaxase [Leptolyngbya sp. BC1307]